MTRNCIIQVRDIILRPETEWQRIAGEPVAMSPLLFGYLLPLALIAPLASAYRLVFVADAAADWHARVVHALLVILGGFMVSPISVLVMALVVCLVAPLHGGERSFVAALRLVVFAGTPVWLAGVILLAPLERFPLLVIIVLIAIMHSLFLFYLGLHHLARVPRRDAAECTAIVMAAGMVFSSLAGYYGSAAGLFPHL